MDGGRPPPFGGAVVQPLYGFDGGNAAVSSLRDLAICEAPIIDHVPNECTLGGREVRRHL